MSASSIQDQGYTPPDFLQKLFKRPSISSSISPSSQNQYQPLSSISNIQTTAGNNNYYSSSPLISVSENIVGRYSPTKLHRAHSLNQEERLSTKKFKIFYNTIIEGVLDEQQCMRIWQKFQKSLNNPFEYDQFIQQLRSVKQSQKNLPIKTQINLSQLNIQKLPPKSKSCEKIKFVQNLNWNLGQKQRQNQLIKNKKRLSARKVRLQEKQERNKMKRTVKYVRGILKHGQKYIKTRQDI